VKLAHTLGFRNDNELRETHSKSSIAERSTAWWQSASWSDCGEAFRRKSLTCVPSQRAKQHWSTIILSEVNGLSFEEQKDTVEQKWPETEKKEKAREAEKRLPPLPNASKYPQIVTRFSPNPDCVLHLGSARAINTQPPSMPRHTMANSSCVSKTQTLK